MINPAHAVAAPNVRTATRAHTNGAQRGAPGFGSIEPEVHVTTDRSAMTVNVLITGVGAGTTGEQVFKAMKLGSRPYDITVANVNPRHLVVAGSARTGLLPAAKDPSYLERLAALANEVGAQFIIPGSDPELFEIAYHRECLAKLTSAIPLANNADTIRACADKAAATAVLKAHGFTVPTTVDCDRAADASRLVEKHGMVYPVVVKPKSGSGGSAHVYVAQDARELDFFVNFIQDEGSTAIIQQYVGDPQNEFTAAVLSYPDGTIAGSFAMRRELTSLLSTRLRVRNRTGRAELGESLVISSGFTQGHVDEFPEVRAAAERISKAMGSTGPLNVQGRFIDGELVVFEINPRFSGTTAMRAMAGWNSPETLIDWHLGLPSKIVDFKPPRVSFIRALAEYVQPT
jgi:carbamoyl-phosphate synthase large subunit